MNFSCEKYLLQNACATASCFDSYEVLQAGQVSRRLGRCHGW